MEVTRPFTAGAVKIIKKLAAEKDWLRQTNLRLGPSIKNGLRGPTPTGIQHKSFRIPIGIWNLSEESEILSEIKS